MTGVQTCALPICFPVTIRFGIEDWGGGGAGCDDDWKGGIPYLFVERVSGIGGGGSEGDGGGGWGWLRCSGGREEFNGLGIGNLGCSDIGRSGREEGEGSENGDWSRWLCHRICLSTGSISGLCEGEGLGCRGDGSFDNLFVSGREVDLVVGRKSGSGTGEVGRSGSGSGSEVSGGWL